MHRFFILPSQIGHQTVRFDADQAHQMRRVLRLRPGDRVLALDGRGRQYEVVLEEVSNARATGRVATQSEAGGEPGARLTLFQSLLPRDKFEWVLQKGTEVGVSTFAPVITRRSLVRGDDVTAEKMTRWERIIREAAEQCGRGLLPRLLPPAPFSAAIVAAAALDRAVIAWEGESRRALGEALSQSGERPEVGLFIGPEGGFEMEEIEEAAAQGIVAVTLGRRILRTETAAVVGAALLLYELGEL
ncbi:Ribosomal RNA small subunit methyltransferase E [Candidatus Promineifilum breve]|uniref:Ribosomal RNA small subunit methyltransferase E n=1 Tax=Candidatus Promineifilum breve TaxID=1806508 RepID=A0A160T487_9CHLR|nr:RsmE family RNA methyltransferase [Candidatus Promineifilum breve]CUS04644.2 Ribosomal RNA small subunit methyltransferase E [Candidatus Promineifilum breve]